MRKFLAFMILVVLVITGTLLADSSRWSDPFRFSGDDTDEVILLMPDDPLAYSSAMVEGKPKTLTIEVEDTVEPDFVNTLYTAPDWQAVEGTTVWDYTNGYYDDYPTYDTYRLTEEVTSDLGTNTFIRLVTIIPEPVSFLLLGLVAVFFLRKRVKSLLAVLILTVVGALSAQAAGDVTEVSCLQMWPFDKSVIINYTVEGYSPVGYDVKFYGSLDGGETTFELYTRGTLKKDGADGILPGPGKYKTIWVPETNFKGTAIEDMMIKVEVFEPIHDGLYMIVDLESGLVRFWPGIPEGGWTDEYKTTKMALRRVSAGTFTMGSPTGEIGKEEGETQHEVTLTEDYFIAIFETTQKQYETIMGSNPAGFKGDLRPVESVPYDTIRGSKSGANWPANGAVDKDSFMGKLRALTGWGFDLPTEAQWEYACRAGTTTAWNNGMDITDETDDAVLHSLGRFYWDIPDGKGGYTEATTSVGSYLPNAWGLYDMHGNVSEWCLDWYLVDFSSDPVTDPVGPTTGLDNERSIRNGAFINAAYKCRSAARNDCKPADGYDDIGFRVAMTIKKDTYMVVDLESGEASYLTDVPKEGWTDEHKTTKMVFRKVLADTFAMGSPTNELGRSGDETQHNVTFSKDFYIGVFETTQKQYETIMGRNPSEYEGDTRPVECVSYNLIRGEGKGSGWPASGDVDEDSFLGKLRAKTGKSFDLPTEAQWEYACRAGTTTALNNGTNLSNVEEDENMNKLGRYEYNCGDGKGGCRQHTAVGSYLPNVWGIYDTHGNVLEWCLDWYGDYEGDVTDPNGPAEGARRVLRGGSWGHSAYFCRSASRINISPSDYEYHYGFRLALMPE